MIKSISVLAVFVFFQLVSSAQFFPQRSSSSFEKIERINYKIDTSPLGFYCSEKLKKDGRVYYIQSEDSTLYDEFMLDKKYDYEFSIKNDKLIHLLFTRNESYNIKSFHVKTFDIEKGEFIAMKKLGEYTEEKVMVSDKRRVIGLEFYCKFVFDEEKNKIVSLQFPHRKHSISSLYHQESKMQSEKSIKLNVKEYDFYFNQKNEFSVSLDMNTWIFIEEDIFMQKDQVYFLTRSLRSDFGQRESPEKSSYSHRLNMLSLKDENHKSAEINKSESIIWRLCLSGNSNSVLVGNVWMDSNFKKGNFNRLNRRYYASGMGVLEYDLDLNLKTEYWPRFNEEELNKFKSEEPKKSKKIIGLFLPVPLSVSYENDCYNLKIASCLNSTEGKDKRKYYSVYLPNLSRMAYMAGVKSINEFEIRGKNKFTLKKYRELMMHNLIPGVYLDVGNFCSFDPGSNRLRKRLNGYADYYNYQFNLK